MHCLRLMKVILSNIAWNDYRRGSFVGFLMAVMSAMIVERTERGDEMFAVMAERSGWQALHLDAVSFLK